MLLQLHLKKTNKIELLSLVALSHELFSCKGAGRRSKINSEERGEIQLYSLHQLA